MHGRASAYFFVVILEYIFDMLGLNEQVDRVVIVCNDFTGISFGLYFKSNESEFPPVCSVYVYPPYVDELPLTYFGMADPY